MYTGGHAQMSSNFSSQPGSGLPMAPAGLSSRRGSQNIKPLSFDAPNHQPVHDNGAPTPRTSRSHLLAGLRTAPKSATATSFAPASPTAQQFARNSRAANLHGYAQDSYYNAPKTAYPQYASQQQQQQPAYHAALNQQYHVEQVLAPPELSMEEQAQDPNLYAQLVATNMYLAQRQQLLQQQLRNVQAAAAQHAAQQQFQNLNISSPQLHHMSSFEQQQQQQLQAAMSQGQQLYFNQATGQYFVDTTASAPSPMHYRDSSASSFNSLQQLQLQLQQHQQQQGLPRVQVSPPPEPQRSSLRSVSPPKRFDSPAEPTPLPPPSAMAFRRGHKKASSLAPVNSVLASALSSSDGPKSAGPKTASFPITPMTGGYGPGQGRAGEHPVRQPRGPPSLDELKAKPTAKHEGSKNFATRTRRSAVHNLVRAGMSRRKGTSSASGSMSPVSETAEDSGSPITDNDSDSGRSGSGSLVGEEECTSSRTSASGGWGAIGSDRPGSRQMTRKSDASDATGSFAYVFKKENDSVDLQRKAPRMVLTSVEKRKTAPVA
ncbi:hypothetical protein ISF_07382 [Cordyceps fumosorosea ARSEF 2679]|uniref:Uncharacterized protein n=1 Tax=Cordyceps fumosorosea (strain ARSEF 2679) TaxID=1081104 RepID=A0A167PNU4_CORFA|nr:hypothetical protein ISF_07382 [Cordyceps fumosorosea ARSEF 2679]OAA56866.1 hypothetical protein ISF_07382 [Cordyceps fumosorosea ARSEF 2679]